MDIRDTIIESLTTLTVNKLRTGLAMLGIVIGIGSVIALVSLGQAAQQSVSNQIQSLGANLLTVSPGSQSTGAVRGAAGGATTLTNDDAKAIQTSPQITTVESVSPEVSTRGQVTAGDNNTNVSIIGSTAAYAEVHKISMQTGRFINDADDAGAGKVAVLGQTVIANLFPNTPDPTGQFIRIKGISFRVIGTTVSKGGTGFANQDNIVYIPLMTAQTQISGQTYLSDISLEAKSQDVMTEAENQVGYLLLSRHKISDPSQADFTIFSQQDILNTASSTEGTFTTLLSGVAAISLLVGGIGIMNIMLVTVTERTREIGLRKALGAKKNTVITQFLIEAILLTFTGGIIGIILGVILSFGISVFSNSIFIISPESILLAFVVSAGIGVLFGWYPASKASNLEPIEALRYE